MLNQRAVNIQARHHIFLQRLGTGEVNRFQKILAELRNGILSRLDNDLTDFSRRRLEAQLVDITSYQQKIYKTYIKELNGSIQSIAINESLFEQSALAKLVDDAVDLGLPTNTQVLAGLRLKPLSIGSNGSGKLLQDFINDWSKSQIDMVTGIIRQGWVEGQTVKQMSAGVRDAIASQVKRTSEAIVRTSINHASQIARDLTWKANNDIVIGWRFLAVLDSRTSDTCQAINSLNEVYKIGEGPQPPRHVNCRSSTIPELDPEYQTKAKFNQAARGADGAGQVSADLTYFDWLKTQPKSFVHDALGVGKGDLLLSGKMTSKQFADFGLNGRFEPLTLAEMIEKDERLNLGLFGGG